MSRLYLQLQQAFASEAITPGGLRRVLQGFIESQNGASTRARLHIRYEHLLQRRALASDNVGWKRYPVTIEAELARRAPATSHSDSRSNTRARARRPRRCRAR